MSGTDARAELAIVVPQLADEECAVLVLLARRLLSGQQTYGRLNLARDTRDLDWARGEELADMLVYGAMAELRRMLSPLQAPVGERLVAR